NGTVHYMDPGTYSYRRIYIGPNDEVRLSTYNPVVYTGSARLELNAANDVFIAGTINLSGGDAFDRSVVDVSWGGNGGGFTGLPGVNSGGYNSGGHGCAGSYDRGYSAYDLPWGDDGVGGGCSGGLFGYGGHAGGGSGGNGGGGGGGGYGGGGGGS